MYEFLTFTHSIRPNHNLSPLCTPPHSGIFWLFSAHLGNQISAKNCRISTKNLSNFCQKLAKFQPKVVKSWPLIVKFRPKIAKSWPKIARFEKNPLCVVKLTGCHESGSGHITRQMQLFAKNLQDGDKVVIANGTEAKNEVGSDDDMDDDPAISPLLLGEKVLWKLIYGGWIAIYKKIMDNCRFSVLNSQISGINSQISEKNVKFRPKNSQISTKHSQISTRNSLKFWSVFHFSMCMKVQQ